MTLKLISTELTEATIQVTYTDGQPADKSRELLILRRTFEGDIHSSIAWNQMQMMQKLYEWAGQEYRRLRSEVEGH